MKKDKKIIKEFWMEVVKKIDIEKIILEFFKEQSLKEEWLVRNDPTRGFLCEK